MSRELGVESCGPVQRGREPVGWWPGGRWPRIAIRAWTPHRGDEVRYAEWLPEGMATPYTPVTHNPRRGLQSGTTSRQATEVGSLAPRYAKTVRSSWPKWAGSA